MPLGGVVRRALVGTRRGQFGDPAPVGLENGASRAAAEVHWPEDGGPIQNQDCGKLRTAAFAASGFEEGLPTGVKRALKRFE